MWYGISFQILYPQSNSMHCNSAMNSWPVICRMFQVVVINTVNLLQTRSQKNMNKIMEKLWYDWAQTWICSTHRSSLFWIEINVLIAIESVDTSSPSSCIAILLLRRTLGLVGKWSKFLPFLDLRWRHMWSFPILPLLRRAKNEHIYRNSTMVFCTLWFSFSLEFRSATQ